MRDKERIHTDRVKIDEDIYGHSPVKRKAVIKLPVIIAAAAALLIVSFGIYGIMTSGKYTATMKDGIADNSPVKKSAGLKVEVDGGETVAEAYEEEDLTTGAAADDRGL